ncbi:unnamed protein product [Notodromas monacha]|uniref:Protein kinase domain-containing protein n=1 Tax=Notodromas monacha TaxID=399045 RepID=A0A7R9BHK8_9CRUS|nr:unnamed protein product [Notodromas monacha]CAG0914267.1 unnamed protein product [Notodromas monacha]
MCDPRAGPWPVALATGLANIATYCVRASKSARPTMSTGKRLGVGQLGATAKGGEAYQKRSSHYAPRALLISPKQPARRGNEPSTDTRRKPALNCLDSFAFGVVLLELLTGMPAFDDNLAHPGQDLLAYLKKETGLEPERLTRVMCDPRAGPWPVALATGLANIATYCVRASKSARPTMSTGKRLGVGQLGATAKGGEAYQKRSSHYAPRALLISPKQPARRGNEPSTDTRRKPALNCDAYQFRYTSMRYIYIYPDDNYKDDCSDARFPCELVTPVGVSHCSKSTTP